MTKRFVYSITLASVGVVLLAPSANASCIRLTAAQQRAQADVIFNGIALEGATATGIQRFRVTGYVKGLGPRIVRVNTGYVRRPNGGATITSVSLVVKRGEKWRIFGHGSARSVVRTTLCDGSRKR